MLIPSTKGVRVKRKFTTTTNRNDIFPLFDEKYKNDNIVTTVDLITNAMCISEDAIESSQNAISKRQKKYRNLYIKELDGSFTLSDTIYPFDDSFPNYKENSTAVYCHREKFNSYKTDVTYHNIMYPKGIKRIDFHADFKYDENDIGNNIIQWKYDGTTMEEIHITGQLPCDISAAIFTNIGVPTLHLYDMVVGYVLPSIGFHHYPTVLHRCKFDDVMGMINVYITDITLIDMGTTFYVHSGKHEKYRENSMLISSNPICDRDPKEITVKGPLKIKKEDIHPNYYVKYTVV